MRKCPGARTTDVKGSAMSDTDRTTQRKQWDAIRRMTPEERVRRVEDLNRTVDTLAEAGIRDAHPRASDREVFLRLAIRKLGRDTARRLYPEVGDLESASR